MRHVDVLRISQDAQGCKPPVLCMQCFVGRRRELAAQLSRLLFLGQTCLESWAELLDPLHLAAFGSQSLKQSLSSFATARWCAQAFARGRRRRC